MDNKDFSNLGKQIQDTVQHAMDSMDFDQLNQTINKTVAQALDEAKLHKEKIQRQYEQSRVNQQYRPPKPNYKPDYTKPVYRRDSTEPNQRPDYRKPVGRKQQLNLILAPRLKKGTSGIAAGAVITGISAWLLIDELARITESFGQFGYGLTIIFLVMEALAFAAGVRLLAKGIFRRKRYRQAKEYAEILNGRGYCEIRELAEQTNESEKEVRGNIKNLIRKRVFREAYMDKQETCLMVNKSAYEYYLQAEESLHEREAAEAKKKEQEGSLSPEILEMIQTGETYIQTIREANDDIPGEVISAKLDRLETVVRRIFDSVKKHPEQKKEMDKFMDYYMPTTLKLVNTYREFDALEVKGTNIQSAMSEIENTLDTITAAFEKLLDDLFQDAAFDVAADISVLQTMLAREGYKEKDFK